METSREGGGDRTEQSVKNIPRTRGKLKTRNTKQSIHNWRVSKKCKCRKREQEKQDKIARKMGI